jgi:hypothetical protein
MKMRQLTLSPNHHYLTYADGAPFFYLGDTAWELFHRLDREESERYLLNRAAKGFTVIQAVALAELDGLQTPNAYGDLPLHKDARGIEDPTQPNEAYFAHIDAVVDIAEALNLFIGMLPTWGNKWKQRPGTTPLFNEENAAAYGTWIGRRYRDKPVIWILGGDQNIDTREEAAVIASMAQGLREGDEGRHLITFHPRGPGLSSDFLHAETWLDFNMIQSSHGAQDHDNGLFVEHDYALEPPKPTVDGEPRYETIPVGFYNADARRSLRFDAYDARQAAYWALLAGACGHTYGNNNIWQMWTPAHKPAISANVPWYEALDHPGAFQMGFARRLFESRPYQTLIPDGSFILDAPSQGGAKVRGARAEDGAFAFVYSPRGLPFTVRMGVIASLSVRASWFDPRYGYAEPIHTGDNRGMQTFTPPTSGRGYDWVLVLDDAERGFPLPGQIEPDAGN